VVVVVQSIRPLLVRAAVVREVI
jgi:hypothetical protein